MSSTQNKFVIPQRYNGSENNVWNEYGQLEADYGPVNLGQGSPEELPPDYVTEALREVAKSQDPSFHQYTRGFGHIRLVTAISKLYSRLIGRKIDLQTEVLVSAGAYEAIFAAIFGHVEAGDEIILIEPFFDCYMPMVQAAGGILHCIPLKLVKKTDHGQISSGDYMLDLAELESLFNSKTKAIILNNPNNPLGKVFTKRELETIAELCKKWNVLCISDEVYEWLVYRPNEHIRIATLPGMWERTITIGSAGKTFHVTGWKTGWAYAPADLMRNVFIAHQNCLRACNTVIQEALAICFEKALERLGQEDCRLASPALELMVKRDRLADILIDAGMRPIIPQGGYFMMADWSSLASRVDLSAEKDAYKDYQFTKWMIKNLGLQALPSGAFYSKFHRKQAEDFIRFCFVKKGENLQKAAEILQKWKWNYLKA